MSYNLFLDDQDDKIRPVKKFYPSASENDFVRVKTFHKFVSTIREKGIPDFISFDNDLGGKKEGFDCAKWLVNYSGLNLKNLEFNVHSANPVAKKNIESLLNNYIESCNQENL